MSLNEVWFTSDGLKSFEQCSAVSIQEAYDKAANEIDTIVHLFKTNDIRESFAERVYLNSLAHAEKARFLGHAEFDFEMMPPNECLVNGEFIGVSFTSPDYDFRLTNISHDHVSGIIDAEGFPHIAMIKGVSANGSLERELAKYDQDFRKAVAEQELKRNPSYRLDESLASWNDGYSSEPYGFEA